MASMKKFDIEVIQTPEPPRGPLKLFDIYSLALGNVIGTGVISLIGFAIAYTGFSAWMAYGAAIIFGLIYTVPYAFMAATFRISGGPYSMISGCFSEFWAGAYSVGAIATMLCIGIFGSAFAQYMSSLVPGVPMQVWSIGLIVLFYFVNLNGIKTTSLVQNIMFFALVASLLAFILVGIPKITNPIFDFSGANFMPNGFWKGFFPAMILLSTSCTGYNNLTPSYGGFARNSTKDMPRAMMLVVPTIMLLYVGTGMVASGVLPLAEIAGQPLTATARAIFPGNWYLLFIIGGPLMCICTTLNGTMPALCQVTASGAESGWLPAIFKKKNKNGMYTVSLTVAALMGIIPNAFGFNVSQIMLMSTLIGSLVTMPLQIAFFLMPTRQPEAWKNSRWHIPLPLYYVICSLSLACGLFLFYNSCTQLHGVVVVINIAVVAVCFLYTYLRARSGKVKCVVSMWPRSQVNDESFQDKAVQPECSAEA